MCFNAPVSFLTFFVGMCIAYEIWNRPKEKTYEKKYDYWNALFIVSFISMQFAEGLAWLNYDIARYLVIYIVSLQPVIQSLGNAYFNNQPLFYIPVIIGLILFGIVKIPDKIGVGPNGHLDWFVNFDNKLYYTIYFIFYFTFMLVPLFWQQPLSRYSPLIIYGVGTLIWTLYNYMETNEFSSMWCFLAIGYAFLAYFVNMKSNEEVQYDR